MEKKIKAIYSLNKNALQECQIVIELPDGSTEAHPLVKFKNGDIEYLQSLDIGGYIKIEYKEEK